MSVVHSKNTRPYVVSRSLTVDEVGVVELTEVRECINKAEAASDLEVFASDCPLGLARPYVKATAADRIEGGMWQTTRVFSAILDESSIGDYKLYKCSTIANREPIAAHPRFSYFAGKQGAEVNGAVFDGQNNFVRFKPYIAEGETITVNKVQQAATEFQKNRKCGITDYLMPIVLLEETQLVLAENLAAMIEELNTIDPLPPSTKLRPFWAKRTWMLTKADPTWVANGTYKLNRQWSLSGPRGWDADIYLT